MQTAFTDLAVRKLPEGYHWDTQTKGLGLRVGKTRRTWVVLLSPGNRPAIGVYPYMSLAEARKECQRRRAEAILKVRVPTPRTAYDDAVREYLSACERKNRPGTVANYRRILKGFPFGRQSIADITPRQLVVALNRIDGPSARFHAQVALKGFFTWCRKQHILTQSPADTLPAAPMGKARDRVLSEDELLAVWKACDRPGAFYGLVRFLILTGCRRGEAAQLRWEWIDEEKQTITFPADVTKNGRVHVIPYGELVRQNLREPYVAYGHLRLVFPGRHGGPINGWGKLKAKLDRTIGDAIQEPFCIHDLRRTYATTMQQLGVRLEVTEALLNHVSGSQSGIVGVYHRHKWEAEKREAVLRYEKHVLSLCRTTDA